MGRYIFFDLDGCLLDSRVPVQECLDAALEAHGLAPIPPVELASHIGPPLGETMHRLVVERGGDPAIVGSLMTAYRSSYASRSLELAYSYPGIPELVAELSERERLGIVTSKPIQFAEPIVAVLGLASFFEVVVGPDLSEQEPKSVTLARALDRARDADPHASVMVGDRRHDVSAALAHGLRPLGVTWGFGTREELLEAGAEAVVDDAASLASALGHPGLPVGGGGG